jgi:hypothetical protein
LRKFLHALNPSFTPPDEKAIRTTLLEAAYNEKKEEVDRMIEHEQRAAFCCDGSTNG